MHADITVNASLEGWIINYQMKRRCKHGSSVYRRDDICKRSCFGLYSAIHTLTLCHFLCLLLYLEPLSFLFWPRSVVLLFLPCTVLTWWIWPISYTRMKSMFCFSSFHCYIVFKFCSPSEREVNSEAFVPVVDAVCCKPVSHTHTHAHVQRPAGGSRLPVNGGV